MALDRFRAAAVSRNMARLAFASQALLRSRLLLAEGDPGGAAVEAESALETRSPWWRLQSLRVLAAAGAASQAQLAEAVTLERSLGIVQIV
jgi:hypothetical protein